MQVYTNMYRLLILAMDHPMLRARELQNIYKAAKGRTVDKMTRRVITGHQSDFNLKLSLVGSGATFYVGVSTRGVPQDMLKLWFSTDHISNETHRGFARAVFFDLCEARPMNWTTPCSGRRKRVWLAAAALQNGPNPVIRDRLVDAVRAWASAAR